MESAGRLSHRTRGPNLRRNDSQRRRWRSAISCCFVIACCGRFSSFFWNRTKPDEVEGINADEAREIKKQVNIPVLVTGGFQTASYIRKCINDGMCDGVAIATAAGCQ